MIFEALEITQEYIGYKPKGDSGKTFGNVKVRILESMGNRSAQSKFSATMYITVAESYAKYFADLRKGDIVFFIGRLMQNKKNSKSGGFFSLYPHKIYPLKTENKEMGDTYEEDTVPI